MLELRILRYKHRNDEDGIHVCAMMILISIMTIKCCLKSHFMVSWYMWMFNVLNLLLEKESKDFEGLFQTHTHTHAMVLPPPAAASITVLSPSIKAEPLGLLVAVYHGSQGGQPLHSLSLLCVLLAILAQSCVNGRCFFRFSVVLKTLVECVCVYTHVRLFGACTTVVQRTTNLSLCIKMVKRYDGGTHALPEQEQRIVPRH